MEPRVGPTPCLLFYCKERAKGLEYRYRDGIHITSRNECSRARMQRNDTTLESSIRTHCFLFSSWCLGHHYFRIDDQVASFFSSSFGNLRDVKHPRALHHCVVPWPGRSNMVGGAVVGARQLSTILVCLLPLATESCPCRRRRYSRDTRHFWPPPPPGPINAHITVTSLSLFEALIILVVLAAGTPSHLWRW